MWPKIEISQISMYCLAAVCKTWNGLDWNGMEWIGMDWNGLDWNGINVWQNNYICYSNTKKKKCTVLVMCKDDINLFLFGVVAF